MKALALKRSRRRDSNKHSRRGSNTGKVSVVADRAAAASRVEMRRRTLLKTEAKS